MVLRMARVTTGGHGWCLRVLESSVVLNGMIPNVWSSMESYTGCLVTQCCGPLVSVCVGNAVALMVEQVWSSTDVSCRLQLTGGTYGLQPTD